MAAQRKVLYLVNPISGTRNKSFLKPLLLRKSAEHGLPCDVLPSSGNGRYDEIARKIQKEQFTDVVICGGDGTINEVVQQLGHLPLRFGILPMGSGNGLAFAAGIPRNIHRALRVFLEGHSTRIDAFRVNDQFACMLCGVGLDGAVAHQFAIQSRRGLGTYAWLTLKAFLKAKSFPFHVDANGCAVDTEAFFLSVANSNQFGNHVTIAPKASLCDGLLDVVIVKKVPKVRLLLNVIKQLLAGKIRDIGNSLNLPVLYFRTSRLSIANPGEAPLHIDGEARPALKQLDIRILPGYFELVCKKKR